MRVGSLVKKLSRMELLLVKQERLLSIVQSNVHYLPTKEEKNFHKGCWILLTFFVKQERLLSYVQFYK